MLYSLSAGTDFRQKTIDYIDNKRQILMSKIDPCTERVNTQPEMNTPNTRSLFQVVQVGLQQPRVHLLELARHQTLCFDYGIEKCNCRCLAYGCRFSEKYHVSPLSMLGHCFHVCVFRQGISPSNTSLECVLSVELKWHMNKKVQ